MYALMLVFYPKCNEGVACRKVILITALLEDIVDFAEQNPASSFNDEESECGVPGWDYFEI